MHVATFNALHLGDNLVHLHFLRKMAQTYRDVHFTHGAPDQHLAQLAPLAHDLANLTLQSIALTGQGSINAWRGAGGWFYQQPDANDFARIHLRWFEKLAKEMGLRSPIEQPSDLLFDYPALRSAGSLPAEFDFLIINSQPKSGQWHGYDPVQFGRLVTQLHDQGKKIFTTEWAHPEVPCTRDLDSDPRRALTVTGIGQLSQSARCILGCVTGPMWPCLNVWNSGLSNLKSPISNPAAPLRIHLLDHERVDLAPHTVHANSLSLVPEILRDRGLL